MIKTIRDISITGLIRNTFAMDIYGTPQNKKGIKTLNFDHPWPVTDYLENIFKDFFNNLNCADIFLTSGFLLVDDDYFVKFDIKSFLDYIANTITTNTNHGVLLDIDNQYILGVTVFDDNFNWLIHYNGGDDDVDEEVYITFSYDVEKFKDVESLKILEGSKFFVGYAV